MHNEGISIDRLGAVGLIFSESKNMDGRLFPLLEVHREASCILCFKILVEGDLCRIIR